MTKARTLADNYAADINQVTADAPLTGGGTSGTVTVGIQAGTTAQSGAVQLTDSTASTSTTTAATPNSVKSAYDLANGAIAKSLVDAKGDLISASANDTPAILAVGSDGDTLLADSAATQGLRWQPQFLAGKNKIINGAFDWNQRAFTSVTATSFTFDRFRMNITGGTVTTTAQTFTPGTAPVAGYEAKNFIRIDSTGQSAAADRSFLSQGIESVRTLAGQTTTVSFWAKAGSGTPKVAVELLQSFGTGGSPSSSVSTVLGQVTLSTSWARYSVTVSLPSISGKTLGTDNNDQLFFALWTSAGSDWNSRTNSLGIQTATIDFWGIQVEAGSVATAFQTATGTLQGELAACQRYYYRTGAGSNDPLAMGAFATSTVCNGITTFPVTMRTRPTALEQSGTASDYRLLFNNTNATCSAVPTFEQASTTMARIRFDIASGGTAGGGATFASNATNGYLGWSAEL